MSLPQTLCPVNISIDSQTCSYDGVNECFNGNVNSVWVQHNPLIIPTKTFHHFKVSAVITMLWGVPDPHNQRLLLSHTHSDTHTYTHIHYTDVHTVHTHTNMLRQIAFAIIKLKWYYGKKEVGCVGNFATPRRAPPLISTPPPPPSFSFLPSFLYSSFFFSCKKKKKNPWIF